MIHKIKMMTVGMIVLVLLLLTGCGGLTSQATLSLDDEKFDDYVFEKSLYYNPEDKIKFRVSPMVEATYLAVEMLRHETGFTNYPSNTVFIDRAVEDFSDFNDHALMSTLLPMVKRGFVFDAIPSSIYHFDEDFRFRDDIEINEFTMSRAGGKKQLETFMVQLKSFRMDSDFDAYFRSNKDLYMELMKRGHDSVSRHNVDEVMENFYGKPIEMATVTVTPFSQNGYGCSIEHKDGTLEMIPTQNIYDDEELFLNVLIHEFSHSFVNPLTSEHMDIVNTTKSLFEPVKEVMSRQAYGSWETAINEHIVRANTALMLRSILGETAYENDLALNRDRGFIYIDEVIGSISYYLDNRDRYPTFDDYYPELMQVFVNLQD
ncbi:MAG: DUF4932 domain-containing protein [Clostridiaceae bacterium]|nr:DUF4932 domain-containing protein [Clostridiaceae bacterium]